MTWREIDHPRGDDGRFVNKLDWADQLAARMPLRPHDLDILLEGWFQPVRREAEQRVHPGSGFAVRVGTGRQLVRPPRGTRDAEVPAEFEVLDYDDAPFGQSYQVVGREPVDLVYRGVSVEEWEQAKERGYLESDRRGVLAEWEGTNAAIDPQTAAYYLPRGGHGVILEIEPRPEQEWFAIRADDYVRTRRRIPLDAVRAVSPVFYRDPNYRLFLGRRT